MALVDKISTIALGSVAMAGASAYYSYSTSIKKEKNVDKPKPKRVIVEWTQAKGKTGYNECLKTKSKTVCGWVYNGLKGVQ